MATRYVEVEFVEVHRVTDNAVLLEMLDGEKEWVPLSQIEDPDDLDEFMGDGVTMIAKWLADDRGMDYTE